MNINKVLSLLFVLAAGFFVVGTVNHMVNTHEGWLSSLLLAGGCLCGAIMFYNKGMADCLSNGCDNPIGIPSGQLLPSLYKNKCRCLITSTLI